MQAPRHREGVARLAAVCLSSYTIASARRSGLAFEWVRTVVTTKRAVTPGENRRRLLELFAGLLIVGSALIIFDVFSARSLVARRGIYTNFPPIYGHFDPHASPLAALSVVAGVSLVGFSFYAARRPLKGITFLVSSLCLFLTLAAAVALVRGQPSDMVAPLTRTSLADYQVDVPVLELHGVRGFVRHYPDLIRTNVVGKDDRFRQPDRLHSVHSISHPPGNIVLLWLLGHVTRSAYGQATLLAFLASLVLIPTWGLAHLVDGQATASRAVVLLAAAPAPLMYAFTSLDAVAAAILMSVVAVLAWAILSGGWRPALVAGLAVAGAFFFTYQASFAVYFAILLALLTNPWRTAALALLRIALGGLVGLVLLRLVVGFDLLETLRASLSSLAYQGRSYGYWLFGNYGAWLTFAGVPMGTLFIREFFSKRVPKFLVAFFLPLWIFYVLPSTVSHVLPGETERVWLFAYPVAAVAAAMWLYRWEQKTGTHIIVPLLVGLSVFQTVFLQAMINTYW